MFGPNSIDFNSLFESSLVTELDISSVLDFGNAGISCTFTFAEMLESAS
ncbi:2499_t:CDS:2 [Dentiscutata erythropus]|uniref:2499_t:CDS:1 n=1 Tax=Dentiscutata erythropus TaxID=1348616 RepID=A0A9N9E186_9GLOM|nr:2499_t:CDS:2 [Dentiscutata erythropus]